MTTPMDKRKTRVQLVRKAVAWQAVGIVCGSAGSVVFGAIVGLGVPPGPGVQSVAAAALYGLGYYLSLFYIWLPISLVLVAGSVIVLARYPELARGKMRLAGGLTVLVLLVVLLLPSAVIPLDLLPLVSEALWFTFVPPAFLPGLSLLGSLDLLLGLVFGVLALAVFGGIPTTFERLAEKPENFYRLLLLSAALAAVGTVATVVGWVLVRRRSVWRISFGRAASLSAAFSVVLVSVSMIGFWADDPAEFRVFLLPAALLGASFFSLRRMHQQQDPQSG